MVTPTLTCAESLSAYCPIVAVAFIHPAFDIVRVQGFSFHTQALLIPPVPLSGLHVQLDRFQATAGVGVTVAVNVTEPGPWMLAGDAVTLSCGGVTVTCAESVSVYSPMTVDAFIHPDLEIARVQGFSFHTQ